MKPPRFTERVARALIFDDRIEQAILGDLNEEWEARVARDGVRAANRWYRREVLRSVPHIIAGWRSASAPATGHPVMPHRMSSLDVKLGIRMLVKYPGLTLVGGLAIAIAVAIGGAWFEFSHDYFNSTLPFAEGDRIVGIRNWNVARNAAEYRALHDFVQWRAQMRTVRDIGGFRLLDRNLVSDDGRSEPVAGVEISASAFRIARVPALLGRPLVDADERPDAAPVVVIGYPLWQTRFGGATDIIGRTVKVGVERRTIVGVMPEGFAFPMQQRLWVPLRVDDTEYPRGQGPLMRVFGKLAPGASFSSAQAELTAIGRRAAADFPATNVKHEPRVEPYVQSIVNGAPWQIYLAQTFFLLILLVACANVATLVFARTATREREIAVRRALGASRARIVSQLFIEALVLASIAAAIGLAVVWTGQGWGMDIFWGVQGGTAARPFWWDSSLASSTIVYVGGLTVLGAAVVGVFPALRATRGDLQAALQQTSADGSGMRFGFVATGVIVVQVALSVLILPDSVSLLRESLASEAQDLTFAPDEFLAVRLEQDQSTAVTDSIGTAVFLARFQHSYRLLEERARAEPGVIAVTAATILPATDQPARPSIEIEGMTERVPVNAARVEPGLFEVFGARVLAGRGFTTGDVDADRPVVVVNESFSQQVLGGRNAIGRRVRAATPRGREPGRWLEIVGVVPDIAINAYEPGKTAGIYQPLTRAYPVQLAIHVRGDAKEFALRLREIAAVIDPSLRIYNPKTLDESLRALALGNSFFSFAMAALAGVALMLSAVGIYSLMSFTVSQRTREIGIRSALGADQRHIIRAIVARALAQVGIGAAVGVVGAVIFADEAKRQNFLLLAGVAAMMLAVALLACVGPLRRALRIQPTDALRSG
jgi:predicted permease